MTSSSARSSVATDAFECVRRGGGRRRLRRPVHAAQVARARPHRARLRGGQRRRRHVVSGIAIRARAVDVESLEYSYQFSDELQQEWEWSERYATQPEILRYAEHVADRFDLKRDIQFNTRVLSAHFDEAAGRWSIATDNGAASARFFILATGCLSSTNVPNFTGLSDFKGNWYHTGGWPHDGVDFTGKRVAVIGTGSSAIQSIPVIAEAGEAAVRVPAHADLFGAGAQRAARSGRARAREGELRATSASEREDRFGFILDANERSALAGERRGAARRVRGALGARRARLLRIVRRSPLRTKRPTTPRPTSSVRRSARSCAIPRSRNCCVRRRWSAANASASTPATTRPTTGRT